MDKNIANMNYYENSELGVAYYERFRLDANSLFQKGSYHDIAETVKKSKPNASFREILDAIQKERPVEIIISPQTLVSFVQSVIKIKGSRNLYIPYLNGIEIDAFSGMGVKLDYSILDADFKDFFQEITGTTCVSSETLNTSEYDVIYSTLPIAPFSRGSCLPQQIVDGCLPKLAPNGIGIFTFPISIIFNASAKKWIKELSKEGFHISAIIDLPEGSFKPYLSLPLKLVIFSRKKSDSFFLAKLKKEEEAPLIADYYLTKENSPKSKALGMWVAHNTFPDFASYENEQRRKRNAVKIEEAYNGKMHSISEICLAVNAPRKMEPSFSKAENAIYVPITGTAEVVTSATEFRLNKIAARWPATAVAQFYFIDK